MTLPSFRFGGFELDPAARELRRHATHRSSVARSATGTGGTGRDTEPSWGSGAVGGATRW